MTWVTRQRPTVDRIACPWLIQRFINQRAAFLDAPGGQVLAVAEREDSIPYDMPNVALGHHGEACSFDAIIHRYALSDPALLKLARIVRGADTAAKDLTLESRGLEALAGGFQRAFSDDHAQRAAELPVYDALYAYCQGLGEAEQQT